MMVAADWAGAAVEVALDDHHLMAQALRVVFVCVGDDDRLDLVEPMLDVPQIRQDQVDAGFVVCREQHTAIDDQQPSQMLENGHVAADFVDTAQRGDAKAAWGQGLRWGER